MLSETSETATSSGHVVWRSGVCCSRVQQSKDADDLITCRQGQARDIEFELTLSTIWGDMRDCWPSSWLMPTRPGPPLSR